MQLFYIHNTDITAPSPGNTYILFKALAFAELGHEIHLICKKKPGASVKEVLMQQFSLEEFPEGFHIHTLERDKKGNFAFYRYAINLLDKNAHGDAVIWTRSMGFVTHLLFFNRKRGHKIYFESHDYFLELDQRDDIKRSRFRKHSLIEKYLFKKLTGILCLTQHMREKYKRAFPDLQLLATSGGLKEFHQDWQEEDLPKMIYVGSLDPHKGVNNIVSLVKKLRTPMKVLVVGARNNDEKQIAEQYFEVNGIGDKVEVHLWQTKQGLHKLLSTCRIGLLPLEPTYFNLYLTSPLKYFDYCAHGLVTAMSDFPCLNELPGDGPSLFVDWSNPAPEQVYEIEKVLGLTTAEFKDQRFKVQNANHKYLWSERAKAHIEFFK